uniref:Uncharacterized protein n=1 Tax=Romanomermis culicivorax TaxID=13658 RepID=A0A915I1K3_ROMCU
MHDSRILIRQEDIQYLRSRMNIYLLNNVFPELNYTTSIRIPENVKKQIFKPWHTVAVLAEINVEVELSTSN